jgi:hypothetical protein
MKVIFLPNNTASLVSKYVPALQHLGLEAVGYNFAPLKISDPENVNNWPSSGGKWQKLKYVFSFLSDLLSSDVIHWVYGGNSMGTKVLLHFVRFLNKKKFVEFSGTDIRILEKMCGDVEHLNFDELSSEFKHLMGTRETSIKTQERFSKAGFYPLPSYPELVDYILPEYFPSFKLVSRSVDLKKLKLCQTNNTKPLIVHAPSNSIVKGTKYVSEAAERLVSEGLADYRLISNMSHAEALKLLESADIVVDQIMAGDYGVLAIEAMALGKPVVCFIRPRVLKYYRENFEGFPIINADVSNIYEVLRNQIAQKENFQKIGERGREFVEKYHDPMKNAKKLISIYSGNL